MSFIIDPDLNISSAGGIASYQYGNKNFDMSRIRLYLAINQGAIPFSNFGNPFVQLIMSSFNENEINNLLKSLIDSMGKALNITIDDYEVKVFNDEIFLRVYTSAGKEKETGLDFTIQR
jgi:hypothetical protein